jgi:tRNA pseudouridine55 synthase
VSADRLQARAWLVDKPAGPTSHDIVHEIRRRLPRGTKVGHAGTLDPFATGLLVILAGRATRLADRISARTKSYRATVRLGARSVTGDPEGPITLGGPVPESAVVVAALEELAARTSQRVPLYSAVHVGGRRLYEHARRGDAVEAPVRAVRILGLELVAYHPDPGELTIDLEVSKGTYIRQIAVDLGEALGCGAYCLALRRTAVGRLRVDDAVAPDEVPHVAPVPLNLLLADLPTVHAAPAEVRALAHGRAVPHPAATGEVAVLDVTGALVAIAAADGACLRPVNVFVDPEQA